MTAMIEQIIQTVMPDARLVRTWALTGGISAHMTAFEVETEDSRRTYTLRRISDSQRARNPVAATHEYRLLGQLAAANLKVPRPIHLDEAAHQYVCEYLPGAPDLRPRDVDEHLHRYALQLAQIHQVEHCQLDIAFLSTQKPKDVTRTETMNLAMREDDIRLALEKRGTITRSNPLVILHGDYWPGNVLWHDGRITGVIDWESCLLGEPLSDLGVARLDVLWVYGEDAMRTFTELYQASMNLDLSDLPHWDLLAGLRPIGHIARMAPAYPLLGRDDVTAETMNSRHQKFVDQALAASGI